MTDARSVLMGSGSPGFTFSTRGDRITGQILTEPVAEQQKIFGTSDLAFWPSGDPKMQVKVQLQTGWRNFEGIANPDPTVPDTGARTVYIKGKHFEKAVRDAIRGAGAAWMGPGDWLSIEYIGDDMSSKAPMKPKMFAVQFQRGQLPQQPQAQQAPVRQAVQQQYAPRPPQVQQYAQQHAPQYAQPTQDWQQPGWRPSPDPTSAPVYPDPTAYPMQGSPFPTPPAPAQAVPQHHGAPESMPAWAADPTSAIPLPTSAPPAPNLSTLDLIKQSQVDGMSGSMTVEPTF